MKRCVSVSTKVVIFVNLFSDNKHGDVYFS